MSRISVGSQQENRVSVGSQPEFFRKDDVVAALPGRDGFAYLDHTEVKKRGVGMFIVSELFVWLTKNGNYGLACVPKVGEARENFISYFHEEIRPELLNTGTRNGFKRFSMQLVVELVIRNKKAPTVGEIFSLEVQDSSDSSW